MWCRVSLIFFLVTCGLWGANCKSPPKLILIRHGEADHNLSHTYNSNPKSPYYTPSHLTSKGKATVEKTADSLLKMGFNPSNIVQVYVSPLPRTLETAEILIQKGVFSKEEMIIDPEITEIQAGDAEGLLESPPWTDEKAKINHGETPKELQKRVQQFYEKIQKKFPCGIVVVITHAPVTMELKKILKQPNEPLSPGESAVYDR